MPAVTPFLRLPLFDGPLDLLLHLCRRQELPLAELPVAEVTAQFLAYLEVLDELQVEVAGEFVEMVALLCLLKSREILPSTDLPMEDADADDADADPRAELIARLLEYKRFREAATELEEGPRPRRDFFARSGSPRIPAGLEDVHAPIDTDLTELLGALRDLLEERARSEPIHAVTEAAQSMDGRMREILALLAALDSVSLPFQGLFEQDRSRARVVVSFLAILELARLGHLTLRQGSPLQALRVHRSFEGAPPVLEALDGA